MCPGIDESNPDITRVLLVDDEPAVLELAKINLEKADPSIRIDNFTSPKQALNNIRSGKYDCIVSDYQMPVMNGLDLCREVRKFSSIPFIIYTGMGSENIAAAAFSIGVNDYHQKEKELGHYNVLARSIRQVVDHKRAEDDRERANMAVQEEKDRLSSLINSMQDEVWFADLNENITLANTSALQEFKLGSISGIEIKKFAASLEVYRPDGSIRPVEEAPPLRSLKGAVIRNQEELVRTPKAGEIRWRQVSSSPVRYPDGTIIGSVSVVRDITDLKKAQEEVTRLASFPQLNVNPIFEIEKSGKLSYLNPSAMKAFPWLSIGESIESLGLDLQDVNRRLNSRRIGALSLDIEVEGKWYLFSCFIVPKLDVIRIYATDITERRRMEEELMSSLVKLNRSEEELRIANEELTSKNERLYAAEDELRSSNEKLVAINEELKTANDHLQISADALKSSEEQVVKEKKRFETILDSGLDGITVNTKGELKYVNDAFTKMMGYTRSELLGKTVYDLHAPEYIEKVREMTESRALGEPALNRYEVDLIKKDGARLPVEYSVTAIEYEGKTSSLTIIRDITERKIFDEELRESREKLLEYSTSLEGLVEERTEELLRSEVMLRNFMDSSTEGFFIYDNDMRLVDLNPVALSLYPRGTSRQDLIGKFMIDIAPGIEKTKRYNGYLRTLETGEPYSEDDFEALTRFGGGYASTRAFKMGEFLGIIRIDVTERIRSEEKLKLAENMGTVSRMSALLAHDLRSPLNVISQSVTAWDRFPDKRDRMLRIIKENADRALSMIEGLRQSTREIVLDRKPTDLNKLLSSIVKETKIPDKVRRHLRVNGDLSAKMIDPAIIRRVLENLIWNAIDAMPGGGNLNITANGRHENIIIEVSDTGTGISDKDKTRIWEPFFTTKPKGFGLGLPFCRRAIEAHGGIIEFDSNVGEGTTFTITLPNKK